MNLVIDDAVEVKQPTKMDAEEKRRELGIDTVYGSVMWIVLTHAIRSDTVERG